MSTMRTMMASTEFPLLAVSGVEHGRRLALAAHVRRWATTVTRVTRKAADALDLGEFEPVPEVQGVTDSWWRGKDSLIAVYRGEAVGLDAPQCLEAHIYGGLDEWGLHGG
ncbi:hypothetical protein OG726_37145 [Streptomyces sp. NBC_01373]|nr:hypothetical protein [Streptomyces sp. NBC_01373]